jgi:hypothetical protein
MSCGCGCGGEVVAYENWNEHVVDEHQNAIAAEYQGRKVTLNKPFRTPGAKKKFGVYTKNGSGTVVIVRFGDPNMEIKRDDPERRKNFRSRHNCDSPGPKWKARYWSCRQWRGGTKVEASAPCGCGCNDDDDDEEGPEEIESLAKRKNDPCTEGYEQYGMKMKNGRKVPNCVPIKKAAEADYKVCADCMTQAKCAEMGDCMNVSKEAALPSPKDGESHEEFMSRCQAMGNSREECMKAHEGHEFDVEGYKEKEEEEAGMYKKKYASECGIDEEFVDGECRKVAVTLDLSIDATNAFVEASTGNTVIEIMGIAFHDGMNKNKWALTKEGARQVARQMEGADLTLDHPDPIEGEGGFGRNTDGGIVKANVGVITSATFLPTIAGGYEVRYVAHVTEPQLFETLESGMYLKEDYGVSIGGSGIPVSADDNGIMFGEDFTFDHLAIVYRPAYERANIESIKRIEKEASIKATFISHSESAGVSKDLVNNMSEENVTPEIDYEAQIESLKADLVLASSRVAEFEAAEEARAEEARASLVERATEIGMSGHEDLQSETLENLIASWEASHPEPTAVEMKPIDDSPAEMETPVVASEEETPVVANFLNGRLVESDEGIYARAYNAWASAWNGTLAGDEGNMRAKTYEEIKEMI